MFVPGQIFQTRLDFSSFLFLVLSPPVCVCDPWEWVSVRRAVVTIRGDECPFSNLSLTPNLPLTTSPPSPLSDGEVSCWVPQSLLIPLQLDTLPLTTTTSPPPPHGKEDECPAGLHKAFLTPLLDEACDVLYTLLALQLLPHLTRNLDLMDRRLVWSQTKPIRHLYLATCISLENQQKKQLSLAKPLHIWSALD